MKTQELIKAYKDGQSLRYCSDFFGVDVSDIKEILRKNGVRIRSAKEQTALTNLLRRKDSLDEEYFSMIDSVNKAWLLGFLAADGTVRKDTNEIKIGLSAVDKEILYKIKNEIKTSHQIKEYTTNSGFDIVELRWSSFGHKKDLSKYGIVNRKTYLPMHVPNLSADFKLAFILGYFDGDGSFSVSKDGHCRFRICSYRDEILNDIASFLNEKYDIKYSLCKDSRGVYELSISTKYAVKILDDMYKLNSICLDRKYQKFLEYINQETTTSN